MCAQHSPGAESAPRKCSLLNVVSKDQEVGLEVRARSLHLSSKDMVGLGPLRPSPWLVFSCSRWASFREQEGRNADHYQKFGLMALIRGMSLVSLVGVVPQCLRDESAVHSYAELFKVGTSSYKAEEWGFFLLLWFYIANVWQSLLTDEVRRQALEAWVWPGFLVSPPSSFHFTLIVSPESLPAGRIVLTISRVVSSIEFTFSEPARGMQWHCIIRLWAGDISRGAQRSCFTPPTWKEWASRMVRPRCVMGAVWTGRGCSNLSWLSTVTDFSSEFLMKSKDEY